jgi:alpha-tubulin suppressor-like RCC1 family protein
MFKVQAARLLSVSVSMKKKRMMVLTMTIAVLAVSSQAMTACQAKDAATQHATTIQEHTMNQGATTASFTDGPEVSTTLSAWGNNYFGQLGDGTYGNNRTTPAEVSDLHGAEVEAIAGGQGHTLALKSDGTVLAWGYNRDGELGDGTNDDSPTPVRVKDFHDPTGNLSGVEAIAAGSSHSLALKKDGTVWAWGDNFFGELGDGKTKTDSPKPVRASDLKGVRAIEGGGWFSLALKNDGSVWAWGYNQDGELGHGTATNAKETKCENTAEAGSAQVRSSCTNSPTPVRVSKLGGVQAIAAGSAHSLALKEDGTVWAWGANDQGQLGNGSKTLGGNTLGINSPAKVKDLAGVKVIAAGLDFSLAGK